ncbi:INO80 complex subunit D [Astyanax mexicanus]|uniref:INO80 complex subunit D n=1 Tax=Astyanax mexicanus TaxID=7994 RepID=UPI0020CB6042|nr:INO80 complex subunit D [Astyanax mexicanus]
MYEGKHIHFSEVDNKPLCSYSPKLCKQRRLNGYAFCIRHVLEDKTAPFKQCEYVAKYNSQRCTNPIPKAEDRRYCNSHLQVLGFIPKKERKKKQDALESVALNITVPSLALKATNGLDGLPPSPTYTRLPPLTLPDTDLLDPFAFYEEDTDRGENAAQKNAIIKRKPHSRLVLGQQGPTHDTDLSVPTSEAFIPVTVTCTLPSSPHLPPPPPPQPPLSLPPPPSPPPPPPLPPIPPPQPPRLLPSTPHAILSPYIQHSEPQGLLCKPIPPQTGASLVPSVPPPTGQQTQPLTRKLILTPSGHPPSAQDCPQPRPVAMRPTAFTAPPACLQRLQHLVQLCAQRHREHGDLFPHLGLDWSEDSADEDGESEERIPSSPQAWRLREGSLHHHFLSKGTEPRRSRIARLCTYLQERYKHLCREERAAMRQKRYRYVFRKALLHAASKDPDCTGELIQQLSKTSHTSNSSRPAGQQEVEKVVCTGSTKGQTCNNPALPFTRHCFQHILVNRSQQLFSSCTARFADGQQCSVPVFDITHQTPLCDEHAKKMDNFLRGDGNRRVQQQLHQQQRRPRKKSKPPALTKKHKKKRRRGPRRPQKPIPPALPQGNLPMPPTLALPTHHASIRSPSTSDLGADELPDDITSDIADIPNDLELNQEDFSDVLPRLPDDLQDFDLFEGKNGELLPTTEEAEELVRALQAMGSYPDSLACLTSMGELAPADGVDHRTMSVFSGSGVTAAGMGDLLNGRIATDNFSSLELEDNLLHTSADDHFPPSPSPQPPSTSDPTAVTPAGPNSTLTERTFTHPTLSKAEHPLPSPPGSHYSSEHVPSPYSDHMSSPHTGSYQAEPPLMLEVPLGGLPGAPRASWSNLPLALTDPAQFGNLLTPDTHLLSTSLSTPPSNPHSAALQPTAALSALPQPGLTSPPAPSMSPSNSPRDLLASTQPKLQLPQFSAAFGHQLVSHSGIPKDLQPSHSSTAPPTGFTIASATAASANRAAPPFQQSK